MNQYETFLPIVIRYFQTSLASTHPDRQNPRWQELIRLLIRHGLVRAWLLRHLRHGTAAAWFQRLAVLPMLHRSMGRALGKLASSIGIPEIPMPKLWVSQNQWSLMISSLICPDQVLRVFKAKPSCCGLNCVARMVFEVVQRRRVEAQLTPPTKC